MNQSDFFDDHHPAGTLPRWATITQVSGFLEVLRSAVSSTVFLSSEFFVLLCSAFAVQATWSGSPRHLSTVSFTRSDAVLCWSSFLWHVVPSILLFFIRSGTPTAHDVS